MTESCINCACYEEEREYCFRLGARVLKNGYCQNYREELKLPKEELLCGMVVSAAKQENFVHMQHKTVIVK